MFDRKVHHFDGDGNLVRTQAFTEIVTNGFPNCLVQGGKFFTEEGKAYPEHLLGQVLNANLKKEYRPDLLTVEECKKFGWPLPEKKAVSRETVVAEPEKLIEETEKLVDEQEGAVTKKRGRPFKKEEIN